MTLTQLNNIKVTTLALNQTVIETQGLKFLVSYESIIAVIKNGKTYLGKNWKYSQTTNKYRSKFLGETTKDTQTKLDKGVYYHLETDFEL